ncbi:hypothetical protein [Olleya aquimaris]|uniref:Uncharacterized protein n=1 Tax=Olleya aquimaris TaxID=639310 RepID=A0A327R742_9FLAO|nr:hypothetical protein [Olleya aquimaris]RAJ11985.1 hypothetical protein LY08_02485 [Olleya aquimaris]
MDNKQQKSTVEKLKSQQTGNKKIIITGSILATIIALTPYLFYIYESVPDQPIWDTFFYTFESKNIESAQIVVWTATGKLVPLLLLCIWFLTCRHWWHHALLVPIIMYAYQLLGFALSDTYLFDEFELIHMVPFMAIIIPSIYLIRARIFNRLNTVDQSIQDLEDELTFKPKTLWGKIKQYF